jgi:hypothetical protein
MLVSLGLDPCPTGQPTPGGRPRIWRRVALIVAKRAGHKVGLDTATQMAKDADFSPDRESPGSRAHVHSSRLGPLDELKRILSRK